MTQVAAAGRGYTVHDLPFCRVWQPPPVTSAFSCWLGTSIPRDRDLVSSPKMTWVLCVLMLYWVSWVWMQAQRGEMHDGPVVFALKDRISLAVAVLVVMTVLLAI